MAMMAADSFVRFDGGYFGMICSRHTAAMDYHGAVYDRGYLRSWLS